MIRRVTSGDTSGRLWVEPGDDAVGPVADVALIGPFEKHYSYRIPPELAGSLTLGQRVEVPVGQKGRLAPGFCVAIDERTWDSTLRPIHSLIDEQSFLTPDLLDLGRWIAQYYLCPLGRTLAALVPEAVRRQSGYAVTRIVRLTVGVTEIEKTAKRIGPRQRVVIDRLAREPDKSVGATVLATETGVSGSTLRAMAARGWIRIDGLRQPLPAPNFDIPRSEPAFKLNDDQRAALDAISNAIDSGVFRVPVLFGVSGSGKTEVYIAAMRRVLAAGRQVVMLVPEIALTTQLVNRLACRFDDVAVIHSGLTGVERSLTWAAIRSGEKRVVIGTRSAVFAPCPNLGLIVVDEEQEGSYKNLRAPRFNVRDVAVKRGSQLGIPVVLGSATPSLETWHNADRFAHYQRAHIPHRVRDLPMPNVAVVDMNDEYKEGTGIPLLSRLMIRGLDAVLSRGEQAVLLMNRRGYASSLYCAGCRKRIACPNCAVNMVLHTARDELVCHYCHRRTPAPRRCPDPSCGGHMVRAGGGTQRVEERLKLLYPAARVVRVDSDTMKNAATYRRIIADFEAREVDVVVGTQMIAKGLDFPFVSFVGVIGADTPQFASDFRATERLFQLVTQVAGRAGRASAGGDVVVQTLEPGSPAIRFAVAHDFPGFAADELAFRRKAAMPPYARVTRIVVADGDDARAVESALMMATRLRELIPSLGVAGLSVLGPQPCAVARMRDAYRHDLLVRAESSEAMHRLLNRAQAGGVLRTRAKSVIVDVDPVAFV